MEYQSFQLGQEFNRNFYSVENCEVGKPPYLTGTVPNNFFFKNY